LLVYLQLQYVFNASIQLSLFILIVASNISLAGAYRHYPGTPHCEPPDYSCDLTLNITVFDQEYSNWDHPAITTITIPDRPIESVRLEWDGYCDPDDFYLRAIAFWVDWRGGGIGVWRIMGGQVSGYGTISPGQTKHWEFDMSNCQFAKNTSDLPTVPNWDPEKGSVYWNFIPQDPSQTTGYFSPGEHTIKAFISSQDRFSVFPNQWYPDITEPEPKQDSWITIIIRITFKDVIGDTLNEISNTLDDMQELIYTNLGTRRGLLCTLILRFSNRSVNFMIDKHKNCEMIRLHELCFLKMTIYLIERISKDPEISDLCSEIYSSIDKIIEFIYQTS